MILCLAKESALNATYPMPTHRGYTPIKHVNIYFKIDPTKAVHCRSAVGTNLDGNGDFMVIMITWLLLLELL